MKMEINLFYRKKGRLEAIEKHLKSKGAKELLGLDDKYQDSINELSSFRRIVDKRGIKIADTVIVPLEDGDRTVALKNEGKNVITVDLNPLSRTAQNADITIVDNVIRVFPLILKEYKRIRSKQEAQDLLAKYNNKLILRMATKLISNFFTD
jgi:4-phosphopantoate--beta-alanine ligase